MIPAPAGQQHHTQNSLGELAYNPESTSDDWEEWPRYAKLWRSRRQRLAHISLLGSTPGSRCYGHCEMNSPIDVSGSALSADHASWVLTGPASPEPHWILAVDEP